jgi:hypothetical protein
MFAKTSGAERSVVNRLITGNARNPAAIEEPNATSLVSRRGTRTPTFFVDRRCADELKSRLLQSRLLLCDATARSRAPAHLSQFEALFGLPRY